MKYLMLVLALSSLNAQADDWTTAEIVKEVALTSLLVIDYKQTEEIQAIDKRPLMCKAVTYATTAKTCETSHVQEMNPILGKHPSNQKIAGYFVATTLGQLALANALPTQYRNWMLDGLIVSELVVTAHNKHVGISIHF